jgi:hypothetical protein
MNNKDLVEEAVKAGFDREQVGRCIAPDSKEAVMLPRDSISLEKLESSVPELKGIESDRFHYWLVRAD